MLGLFVLGGWYRGRAYRSPTGLLGRVALVAALAWVASALSAALTSRATLASVLGTWAVLSLAAGHFDVIVLFVVYVI